MLKIKVGQVYETTSGLRYIITCVGIHNTYLLYNSGYCVECSLSDMNNNYSDKLIAEHPTWRQAVNSEEFNNGEYL